jgi:hypothetical protein
MHHHSPPSDIHAPRAWILLTGACLARASKSITLLRPWLFRCSLLPPPSPAAGRCFVIFYFYALFFFIVLFLSFCFLLCSVVFSCWLLRFWSPSSSVVYFFLETFVPDFRCVLSPLQLLNGFTLLLQIGQILGQLLYTPFCGAFSWFCDQDPEDQAIFFGSFSIICL